MLSWQLLQIANLAYYLVKGQHTLVSYRTTNPFLKTAEGLTAIVWVVFPSVIYGLLLAKIGFIELPRKIHFPSFSLTKKRYLLETFFSRKFFDPVTPSCQGKGRISWAHVELYTQKISFSQPTLNKNSSQCVNKKKKEIFLSFIFTNLYNFSTSSSKWWGPWVCVL